MQLTDDSLWWLTAPVALWTAHFGAVYGVVAIGCPRLAHETVYGAIVVVTLAAAIVLAALGARGVRRYRREAPASRFLGLVTALLAGASAVGVLYSAGSVALVGGCS